MADMDVPLFDVEEYPALPESLPRSEGPCEAQLAQLLAAVANLATRVESVVEAVNSIGEITEETSQQITAVIKFIDAFQKQFAGMSPGDMIKSLLRGGSNG